MQALHQFKTQTGQTLAELADRSPLLLIFLRHGGCPFCRKTLAEIAARQELIEREGTRIALIHLMPDDEFARLAAHYGLVDLDRVSDPAGQLYQDFDLKRGTVLQVMGPAVWWQGLKAVAFGGHRPGRPNGDIYQLPGAFLVDKGRVLKAFRPGSSGESTDFVDLATCPREERASE